MADVWFNAQPGPRVPESRRTWRHSRGPRRLLWAELAGGGLHDYPRELVDPVLGVATRRDLTGDRVGDRRGLVGRAARGPDAADGVARRDQRILQFLGLDPLTLEGSR